MKKVVTLNQFITEQQSEIPQATGEFSRLLHHLGIAAKKVNRAVNKAGLVDVLGKAGTKNIQNESQQKLDIYANEIFIEELLASGVCCGVVSEENQDIVLLQEGMRKEAKYIICIDPLDGSSNIDVNVSIGTIFSIYRRLSPKGTHVTTTDFLQKGDKQIAAGYIIYGSSTMLVYTAGNGVNGFTLDPSIGEFCLSHPDIHTPNNGSIYSVNEGHYVNFPDGVKKFIKYCQEKDEDTKRPFTSRYIGSLVADFHRNLLKGGVFLYPQTASYPKGKLRLLYECNSIAFIAEQAGGMATDGYRRILDIKPADIHERTPFYVGSSNLMKCVMSYLVDR